MGRKKYIILFLTFIVMGVTILFSAMPVSAETSVAQEKETSGYTESGSELLKLEDVLERNTSGYAGIDRGKISHGHIMLSQRHLLLAEVARLCLMRLLIVW